MIAEHIRRPYILSSHWRHIQKAVSGLLMPGAQYKGRPYLLHTNQHFTSHPSVPESITTHAKKSTTAASAAAPLFPDKNKIACEYFIFLILIIFLHALHYLSSLGVKTLIKILRNRGALLL